jgi:hypothetical protein
MKDYGLSPTKRFWKLFCLEDGGFEVFTTVISSVFWDVTPCSPVQVHRCFGGSYCLHFHSRLVTQATARSEQQAEPG